MLKNSKIYVAGSNGMVGSAIVRNLRNKGFENIVTKSSKELDLRSQKEVFTLLGRHLVMWLYKLDHYIQVIKHFSEVDLSRYIVFSFKTFTIHISCPLKRLKDELLFN